MAAPRFRHNGIMQKRRDDIKRVDAMTVKVTRVTGRILVIGAGEVAVEIPFPVIFSDRPNFGFGGEMDDNFHVTAGSYPTISAIVTDWDVYSDDPLAQQRYNGATVAMVTTGQADQQIWLHYSFEGKAMRNPIHGEDTADDAI